MFSNTSFCTQQALIFHFLSDFYVACSHCSRFLFFFSFLLLLNLSFAFSQYVAHEYLKTYIYIIYIHIYVYIYIYIYIYIRYSEKKIHYLKYFGMLPSSVNLFLFIKNFFFFWFFFYIMVFILLLSIFYKSFENH